MNTLTVTVAAGLGNRFRAIASTLALHKETGIPVTIIWTPCRVCRIHFEDLFMPHPLIKSNQSGVYTNPVECNFDDTWTRLPKLGNMHISTWGEYYKSPLCAELVRTLQPRQEYLDKVSALFGDRAMVGVHIRRTDHNSSIQNSPTDLFIQEMGKYPTTTHFFLASDSETEKARIRDAYGNRVHTFQDPLNRYTMAGMKSSFTDFIALSKCSELITSYESTFSEWAAITGNIPMHVISSRT